MNYNNNYDQNMETEVNSLKDYIRLIRLNLLPILLITFSGLVVSFVYALNAVDIYKSTTVLKISEPQGNILDSPIMPEFQSFGNDRFIANEIEVLKSHTLRTIVAEALLDSFVVSEDEGRYSLVFNEDVKYNDEESLIGKAKKKLKYYIGKVFTPKKDFSVPTKPKGPVKSIKELVEIFDKKVSIDQKRGLDIVEITVESPSPYEAKLLADLYAEKYKELDLQYSRKKLFSVRDFLGNQREQKLSQLNIAEDAYKSYQEKGGVIELSTQSQALIDQLSEFEAQKNSVKIELSMSEKALAQLKKELSEQNPKLTNYLESFASEPYLKSLQEQIARFETNREMVLSDDNNENKQKELIEKYDNKIEELRKKLDSKIAVYKAGIFASSPEEIKALTQKVLEEEVKLQSLKASFRELSEVVNKYQKRFNQIPKRTIDLARLERKRKTLEKLYLLVEEKYQEAQINIKSTPGNVLIIDSSVFPIKPAKPNRMLIVLVGLVLGFGMGIGFAFLRNFLDNTVKTPEDIQKHGLDVLSWIPEIEGLSEKNKEFEFIVANKPDAIPSEAFRALRTRLFYSKLKSNLKTILVTSSAPSEGKTTVAVNLAGSFALAGKKTLIIDADLRKPRLHTIFKAKRQPGFTDYFFNAAEYDEIFREAQIMENLYYVTAGTIPPNPSEILGSEQMEQFLRRVNEEYDAVIIDSAPVIAVTDSEILSRLVDGTLLVVSANETEDDIMQKATDILKHDEGSFIGVILNKFSYKAGYGNYYKYYYYYSRPALDKKKK